MCWAGKTPRVIIKDPELMKEVLTNKQGHFQKPPMNPLITILTKGLTTIEGDMWAKHRKIINPAFHLEKLKVFFHFFIHFLIDHSRFHLLHYYVYVVRKLIFGFYDGS